MALADESWPDDALDAIVELADAYAEISADDLRTYMRPAPSPAMVGSAFAEAKRLGYIEPVDFRPSTSRSRRSGRSLTWRARIDRKSS